MTESGGSITLDEFQFYGRQRFEVAAGQVIFMPPEPADKPRLIARLLRRLERTVRRGGAGELLADTPFILEGDRATGVVVTARRPDLAYVSRGRSEAQAGDGPWWLAPDLAIDILAPGEPGGEGDRRAADYLRGGARLVWLVDSVARAVRVHSADEPGGRAVAGRELLSAEPVIAGWAMEAGAVFGR